MSKIAFCTDLHIGARNDNTFIYENQKKFFDEVFFPYLEKNKIKTIINLGDTFDKRKVINTHTLYKARKDIFSKFNEYDCHFLTGNHDVYLKSHNYVNSVSECLADFENIKIYSEPTTINIDGFNICLIPWINSDNHDRTMTEIENTKARLCLGHLELTGYEFHRGSLCKHGMSKKIFTDKFVKTISGHFHKKSEDSEVIYLGTAYQTTWIEHEEIKGFHVFDIDTWKLEFVENPFNLFVELNYPEIENVESKFTRVVVSEEDSKTLEYQTYISKLQEMKPAMLNTKLVDIMIENKSEILYNADVKVSNILDISKEYIRSLENFSRKDTLEEEFEKLYNLVKC